MLLTPKTALCWEKVRPFTEDNQRFIIFRVALDILNEVQKRRYFFSPLQTFVQDMDKFEQNIVKK